MAQIIWDAAASRYYETGLDRGVLYFPSEPGKYDNGVAWNGLISISEDFSDDSIIPYYYDGVKYAQEYSFGEYKASLNAYTYPDEFSQFVNIHETSEGFFIDGQRPKTFGLCYRTSIGSDVSPPGKEYKLHLVYNLIAEPSDNRHETITGSLSVSDFTWDLYSVPEQVSSYRPTAHVILDSRYLQKSILATLETILYGSDIIDENDIIDGGTPESSGDGFLDGELPLSAGFGVVDGNPGNNLGSANPRLPPIDEIVALVIGFDPKFVVPDTIFGLANLVSAGVGDLTPGKIPGLYDDLPTTRLIKSPLTGVYYLEELRGEP